MPSTPFSIDTILSLPIFKKWVLLAFVLYRSTNLPFPPYPLSALSSFPLSSLTVRAPPSWALADRSTKFAYGVLALYFGQWLSDRWRNGVFNKPSRIRGQEQWGREIAFVTGGANGIGKATVDQLARKGCKVAAVDIVDFKSSHPNVRTYKCDITSIEELRQVQKRIQQDFGGEPTMVLNIAGINNHSLILDLDERKVTKMLDVNLKSHFLTALVFLPDMIRKKRGHFMSVGSTMSLAGITHQSDYVAAKHGLVGMLESFRYELDKMYHAPHVRTTLVVNGHTATQLFKDFKVTHGLARFMGPLISPESLAERMVDALEAQESRYVCHPFQNRLSFSLRAMPSYMRDFMQFLGGADGTYPSRPTAEQLGH